MSQIYNSIYCYVRKSLWYGLVLSSDKRIIMCNPALLEELGKIYPESLDDVFGNETESVQLLLEKTSESERQIAAGVNLDFGDGLMPVYIQATFLEIDNVKIYTLMFHSVYKLCRSMKALTLAAAGQDGRAIVERMKKATGSHNNRKLAEWLGVRESAISAVINGREVPYKWRCVVCEEAGVNYHWLMSGSGDMV